MRVKILRENEQKKCFYHYEMCVLPYVTLLSQFETGLSDLAETELVGVLDVGVSDKNEEISLLLKFFCVCEFC
jgi:hypothetical protein